MQGDSPIVPQPDLLYHNLSIGPQQELVQLLVDGHRWASEYGKGIPCWSCKIFSMHSTNVQIMNWKHDSWIWWGSSCVGSVPRILKSPVTHLTTSNWSRWKIMMHQVRLWVNWCIFLHQVRVCGSRGKKTLCFRSGGGTAGGSSCSRSGCGSAEWCSVPCKAVSGRVGILFLCQVRLWASLRMVLS